MSYDIEHFVKWIRANDLTPIMSVVEDDLELLTQQDIEHLTNDIKRAYNIIINEWIEYLIYLKNNYPYLYVSAVTINPFLSGFTPAGNKRFM
mgnify:CR=1 FL=1